MSKIVLSAKSREIKKKEGFKGWVKGVVYGPELKENKLVWVKLQDFNKVYEEAGHSTLVDLKIEGDENGLSVLLHDMQYDGLTSDLNHIDFYKVKMGEKIDTSIELEFIGEAPAVKEKGGILVKALSEIDVRCFPRHLVSEIEVNLTSLKEIEDSIYIKDLNIPKEIEVTTNTDTVVALISRPRTEEELESLDEKVEMDVDKIEVEKGGKEEAEEGEGEAGKKDKSEEKSSKE